MDMKNNPVPGFTAERAKVIVADDDEVNIAVAVGLLNKTRAQIYPASGGGECLELLGRIYADIVLLDFNMGDMDGFEVLEKIRITNPTVPVVVFTGNALSGAKEMYLQKGFTDYLAKPVRSTVLYDVLLRHLPSELIRQCESREQNRESNPVPQIEGLDVLDAIERTGGYENFKEAIRVFHLTLEDRIEKISFTADTGDDAGYAREVHSLKSAAKLIGAVRLSNLAGYMEIRGHKRGSEIFRERNQELIELLRHTGEKLKPHVQYVTQKREANIDIMTDLLRQLAGALTEFDVDSADACIANLDTYQMEDHMSVEYTKLKACVANLNVTEALKYIAQISNLLKGGEF